MVRRRDRNDWVCRSKQIVLLDGLFDCLSIWRSKNYVTYFRYVKNIRFLRISWASTAENLIMDYEIGVTNQLFLVKVKLSRGVRGLFVCFLRDNPQCARASFTRFLDHTQRRTTVGRTPLDEWSARRRDLYLTTHNTHNRQTYMPPGGIRTHILSRREAVDLRLIPHGHCDWQKGLFRLWKLRYQAPPKRP
jgi:hypothetical protein